MSGPEVDLPVVSIVVPMLDERGHIPSCLDSFARQTYPADRLDLVVVDGGSTDGSREVVEAWMAEHAWVRLVDNPARRASAAFNRGVEAAVGEVVVLFSAHGVADPEFVARSVSTLFESDAAGVGGRLIHEGLDPAGQAVGLAMTSPVGMASPFRYASTRRDVDTIGHPAYRRQVLDEVGAFDESLERNSDYELNWRIRDLGHRLVFEPSIITVYRPRGSLRGLARQFWWYGRWKARVVRAHPASLRIRHLVPPTFVAAIALGPVLALTRRGRRVLAAVGIGYAAVVGYGTLASQPRRHHASPVVLAAAFPVMHLAWGAGLMASVAQDVLRAMGLWQARNRDSAVRNSPHGGRAGLNPADTDGEELTSS